MLFRCISICVMYVRDVYVRIYACLMLFRCISICVMNGKDVYVRMYV